MEPTVLHADLDAFYASVEQMLDPRLRGRPVLVGGGVVVAASYEARAYGITAPMSLRDARELCPHAVVVEGHFARYLELAEQVMAILESATPVVEQVSVDEAFLDVSGSVHLLGPPSTIGRGLRERVRCEIGLPLSIGIASTKFLAKIASARAKPDGLLVVPAGRELDFLHPLPVEAMWGVGRVTAERLGRLGITTVGELAASRSGGLTPGLGRSASSSLAALAWNQDPRPVRGGRRAGSVGSQRALGRGLTDSDEMSTVVVGLADRVGRRLRAKGRVGSRLTLRVRIPGRRVLSRSCAFPGATASTATIQKLAMVLLLRALGETGGEPVTLIGISVGALASEEHVQLDLGFDEGSAITSGSWDDLRRRDLDRAVDAVRERFGSQAMRLGGGGHGEDDAFRRLWERS